MKPRIETIKRGIIPVYDLEKGKEGGIYSSVDPWITKENCPIILPAEKEIKEIEVFLVRFGYRGMKTEEVEPALNEKGLTAAKLPHLLGLGKRYSEFTKSMADIPDEEKDIRRILALGETFPYKDENYEFVSTVYIDYPSILSRNLRVADCTNVCWYAGTSYFLAIAK